MRRTEHVGRVHIAYRRINNASTWGPSTLHNMYHICRVADPNPHSGALDKDSIWSMDPDPYSESGSGSRRAKMATKVEKK